MPTVADWQPRIWALWCPFTKTGFPVMGSFGKSEQPVIVMTAGTWGQLCERIPELSKMDFEVGTLDG